MRILTTLAPTLTAISLCLLTGCGGGGDSVDDKATIEPVNCEQPEGNCK